MDTIKIVSIRKHVEGKYLVKYEKTPPCMCSTSLHVTIMIQKKEPTQKEALKFINENSN